jgi:GNAT superfamily N-acetyltransferase
VTVQYDISDDPLRLDVELVHRFLNEDAYWSRGISLDVVERALAGSLCVGAYTETGAQVGFARAVTDRATFAWIADVFVLEPHRGRGVGRAMVRALVEHPAHAGVRRFVLATVDAHGVYSELGFEPLRAIERFMAIELDPEDLYTDPA